MEYITWIKAKEINEKILKEFKEDCKKYCEALAREICITKDITV